MAYETFTCPNCPHERTLMNVILSELDEVRCTNCNGLMTVLNP